MPPSPSPSSIAVKPQLAVRCLSPGEHGGQVLRGNCFATYDAEGNLVVLVRSHGPRLTEVFHIGDPIQLAQAAKQYGIAMQLEVQTIDLRR